MPVILDFDDLCSYNPLPKKQLDILYHHFECFKVTVLAIPGLEPDLTYYNLPYLRIGVHGKTHEGKECEEWTKEDLKYLDFLPHQYAKVFRAPRWSISDEAIEGLLERGYIVCLHPNHPWQGEKGIYRSQINPDQIKPDGGTYLAHGHLSDDQPNGLNRMMFYLLGLPKDTDFMWIEEWVDL